MLTMDVKDGKSITQQFTSCLPSGLCPSLCFRGWPAPPLADFRGEPLMPPASKSEDLSVRNAPSTGYKTALYDRTLEYLLNVQLPDKASDPSGEDSFSLCSASHCPSISVLARPPWHLKDTASSVLPTFPFSFSRVRHLHLENKTRAQQCVAATVSFISRLPASHRTVSCCIILLIGMSLARVPPVPYLSGNCICDRGFSLSNSMATTRSIANSRRPSSADFFLLLLFFFQGSNHFLSPAYSCGELYGGRRAP